MTLPFDLQENVPLAPLTTLEVGGATRYLATCHDLGELSAALEWAQDRHLPVFLLGGGSNVLVADRGFQGVTIRYLESSRRVEENAGEVLLRLGAGQVWDDAASFSVEQGLGGIECLSGIPGLVGAAPLQNIGAYGQDVAETLVAVEGIEISTGHQQRWTADACQFGYRTSAFKTIWRGRHVITAVELKLPRRPLGEVRYAELARRLQGTEPTLAAVRQQVLAIRASKSMLLSNGDTLDSANPNGDANRRSAGSFFVNPVVSPEVASNVQDIWCQQQGDGAVPVFDAADGGSKLSAAWLIERSGFPRGTARGAVGLSSRHTLALINRGGARAVDLVALAAEIRAGVYRKFGVTLVPEPHFLGFEDPVDVLLGCPSEGLSPRIPA